MITDLDRPSWRVSQPDAMRIYAIQGQIAALQAEVERLREALEKAESYVAGNPAIGQNERGFLLDEIVRPALQSKGGKDD